MLGFSLHIPLQCVHGLLSASLKIVWLTCCRGALVVVASDSSPHLSSPPRFLTCSSPRREATENSVAGWPFACRVHLTRHLRSMRSFAKMQATRLRCAVVTTNLLGSSEGVTTERMGYNPLVWLQSVTRGLLHVASPLNEEDLSCR